MNLKAHLKEQPRIKAQDIDEIKIDLGGTLVGFANDEVGELFIGVDGAVSGISLIQIWNETEKDSSR